MNSHNLDEITLKFYEIIWPKFDKSFPLIKVRTSSRDPPFMSPLVNHLLNQRKRAIQNGNTEANTRLQEKNQQVNSGKSIKCSQTGVWQPENWIEKLVV